MSNIRVLLSVLTLILFISPLLVLISKFNLNQSIDWKELVWALKNSSLQALISALFCMVMGFIAVLGLFKTQDKNPIIHAVLVGMCLLPQFLPPIVILISIMNGLQPFPMGLAGIVIVHAFSYFGMTALLIENQAKNVLSQNIQVAQVLGVSRFRYWWKVGIPLLRKDLILILTYLIAVFFTSFSIPLIVGGGKGTTLEVLIYEKVRFSTDWSSAVTLSLVQTVFIFLLSFLALKGRAQFAKQNISLGWLGSHLGVFLVLIVMAGFIISYSSGVVSGLQQIGNLSLYGYEIIEAFLASMLVAFLTYCLFMCFLYLFCSMGFVNRSLDLFMSGYIAPSTALTCFAILILFPSSFLWSYVKIPIAFLLLGFPSLYRLGWGEKFKSLKNQVQIAQTMGARPIEILKSITWPQMKSHSRFMSGLMATWACGDFAVSRILSTTDFTLGLIVESLLTSYRMGMASLMSFLLIVACGLFFSIILGMDYVDRRKFKN
jgi:thiamine transport system permease protein